MIGYATVHTPVLKSPLTGPAYLVSHGDAKFPDVEFVLQGEGITLVLDGQTDIKNGSHLQPLRIRARRAVHDASKRCCPRARTGSSPPTPPKRNPTNLCATKLQMPTTITAQNGAVIEQDTSVVPDGCSGVAATHNSKPTRAQQLAKALTACRHKYRSKKAKAQTRGL